MLMLKQREYPHITRTMLKITYVVRLKSNRLNLNYMHQTNGSETNGLRGSIEHLWKKKREANKER